MENQQEKTVVAIAMPAIYRLSVTGIEKGKDVSKWGWHRADELLAAVQLILADRGKGLVEPDEICRMFPWTHPQWRTEFDSRFQTVPDYLVVDKEGRLWRRSTDGEDWLRSLAEKATYLPAKIGMRLIQAAKHPILSRLISD